MILQTPMQALAARTYVALLHHPVLLKDGTESTTAVTNLDVHDIARACKTFGLGGYYVITPVAPQRVLVERILHHWQRGYGATHNEIRSEALALVRVAEDLEKAENEIRERLGSDPLRVVTSGRFADGAMEPRKWAQGQLLVNKPVILLFGTGWGLGPSLLSKGVVRLKPILGQSSYNHLSVRSAVAIYLDRLFSTEE